MTNILKRGLAMMLAVVIASGSFSGLTLTAKAETVSGNEIQEEVTTVFVEKQLELDMESFPEHEELFAGYVENLLYSEFMEDISTYANVGANRLQGDEKEVYEELKKQIGRIASGKTSSTVITLDEKYTWEWTAKELGVSSITSFNCQSLADEKFAEIIDVRKLIDYLLMDCPYDFYWYDKTMSTTWGYNISYTSKYLEVTAVVFQLPVAEEYRVKVTAGASTPYKFDVTKVYNANKAKSAAMKIADKYKDKSDYEKLAGFKQEICELTDYNYSAINHTSYTAYGNPWQMIWVFDGDSNTKVVCEGYSKAFQYLCDLAGLSCYTVNGTMDGGDHMWNIVTLDGKNYLVDVTNSDAGTVGENGELFLAGTANGSAVNGYRFSAGMNVYYKYDDSQMGLLGEEILTLASHSYGMNEDQDKEEDKEDEIEILNPVNVTASAVSGRKIELSWDKNEKAEGYMLYMVDGTELVELGEISSGETVNYTVEDLMPNTVYSFAVAPYHTVNGICFVGNVSEIVSAQTMALAAVTLTAEVSSYTKIKLNWSENQDADGYYIYRLDDAGEYYELIKTITSGSTLTYTDTKLTTGKEYEYVITPVIQLDGQVFEGEVSLAASAKPLPATAKISKVECTSYKTLKITWEKVSGASGYEVYRSDSSGSGYKLVKRITSGSTVSYKDTKITPNKRQYYKVRAYRTVDGKRVYGEFSKYKSGKSVFAQVESVTAKAVDYTSIKVSWDKASGATKYQVYYSTSKNSGYKRLKTTTSTSYTWKKPTCGTTYYFKVRAVKVENGKDIYGTYSTPDSAKTKIGKPTAKAVKKNYNSITVSWNSVAGAQKYEVYWSTSKNSGYKKLKTTTGTSYTHTGRTIGKKYYYKVRAIRQNSTSSYSSIVNASTSLGAITDLKARRYGNTGFQLSWNEANGATTYFVYRSTSETTGYKQIATVTSTSYIDQTASSADTYYYKVIGYRGSYKTEMVGPVEGNTKLARKGVDVSEYQARINWEKAKADDVEFAMLRIVKGGVSSMATDARFEDNYKNARAAGVKVGVYRYSYATNVEEAKKEARKVLEVLNGRELDYPVVLDVEDKCMLKSGISNSTRSKMVLAFKEIVEAAGYEFAVYANLDWCNNYLNMDLLKDVDLWLARWRSLEQGPGYTGKGNLIMWQYTDRGRVDGIPGFVDLDVSY